MNEHGRLKIIESMEQESGIVEDLIRQYAARLGTVRILEAGCGRHWPYRLEGLNYILTGIDVDKAALELRQQRFADLHETIEGDLCTVDLGAASYDVIFSSFVLEHIERADIVLKNFVKWIKPDGMIILKIPDPDSVLGFLAHTTPFWFHVFCYRYILGSKNAGTPGYGPYPTYYHSIVSRRGIHEFCDDGQNHVELAGEYLLANDMPGRGVVKVLLKAFFKLVNIVSVGSLKDKHSALLIIIRKQSA